jgi:hypothetical protein
MGKKKLTGSKIRIDKNIPMPESKTCLYPWAEMKKGDSFFIKGDDIKIRPILSGASRAWAARHNLFWKWRTKAEGNGIRIWRIE